MDIIGFDFDGVLINSLNVMEKSWVMTMNKHNLNVPFKSYKSYIGIKFSEILKKLKIDKKLHDSISNEYFKNTRSFENDIELYPNVNKTINELKKNGYPTFINTSKPRNNTVRLLNLHNIDVDFLICSDDVTHGKPHPESSIIIKNYFLKFDKIYYVGDMQSDLDYSINANFIFIHANYGYGNIVDSNVKSISDLSQIFKLIKE